MDSVKPIRSVIGPSNRRRREAEEEGGQHPGGRRFPFVRFFKKVYEPTANCHLRYDTEG